MSLEKRCETFIKDPRTFAEHAQRIANEIDRENKLFKAFIQHSPLTTAIIEDHIERNKAKTLFGSIVAVKASIKTKGYPWDAGFKPALMERCSEDAALVKAFRDKGAFVIGVTNLDEGCFHAVGDNKLHGRMLNPLDPNRSPLGSSGGSAIAVAKGWADIALGSDSGGSMRAPAAACGISSLLASKKLLPTDGYFLAGGDLDFAGLFAKSLDDLRFAATQISLKKTTSELGSLALLTPSEDKLSSLSTDWKKLFSDALKKIEASFPAKGIPLPFDEAAQARKILLTQCAAKYFATNKIAENTLTIPSRLVLEFGKKVPAASQQDAQELQNAIREGLSGLLAEGGFLLTPTISFTPPTWKEIDADAGKALNNIGFFLSIVNVAGLCAVSFPCSKSANPVPLSLQLVGLPGEELKLLQVASAIQLELNG